MFPAESRDDESAVALPRSEFSLGICTFNCGRLGGNWPLFVRTGGFRSTTGWGRGASVAARGGGGGGFAVSPAGFPSFGPSVAPSAFVCAFSPASVGGPTPKWRANTEPRSSMGVKILRDLEERDRWCGGDGVPSVFMGPGIASVGAVPSGSDTVRGGGGCCSVVNVGGMEFRPCSGRNACATCGMAAWGGWVMAIGGGCCESA